MELGKLYEIKRHYWFLYQSMVDAVRAVSYAVTVHTFHSMGEDHDGMGLVSASITEETARIVRKFLPVDARTHVNPLRPKSFVVPLAIEQGDLYVKLLLSDGTVGWIVNPPIRNKDIVLVKKA